MIMTKNMNQNDKNSKIIVWVILWENWKIKSIQYNTSDMIDWILEISKEDYQKTRDINMNPNILLSDINKKYLNKVEQLINKKNVAA